MESYSLLFEVATAQYLTKRAWGHSGDLTADLAPGVGHFDNLICQIPVFSHPTRGGGWGMKLTKVL